MIQKNIYLAAKKHKFNYVHQLQKYLISSNDIKIICLKNIIDQIPDQFVRSTSFKHFLKSNSKYFLFNLLGERYLLSGANWLTINQQINSYLIHLCIAPVNKAKLKKSVLKYSNRNNNNYAKYLNYIYNNYQYSFKQLIIDRLNAFEYIHTLVTNCIYSKNLYSLLNIYNIHFQKRLLLKFNETNYLILNSLFLDKIWFFFRTHLKKKYIKSVINTINNSSSNIYYNNVIKNNEIFNLSQQFKNFLSEKIYKKFQVIYILNYNSKFIDALIKRYFIYYCESRMFASCSILKYHNNFINIFLYTYCNRRTKTISNFLLKMFELNYSFNVIIYYYNILNLYFFN
uniref:Uncharacterized protein n=1 Tax=Osmundea sinicola TaxID=290685 RepID=A0A7L4WPM1_9FLOR|nr:hypothetical protein [Osmundea sinicola]QFR99868.1 hypothetical protein [Osmundea sinicola]